MPASNHASRGSSLLQRFALRLLPPHRKDWGAAMFNEIAHLPPDASARRWLLGCALTCLRERLMHELGWTTMTKRLLKISGIAGFALLIVGVGIYVSAKPYQRERIWITVHHALTPASSAAAPEHPRRD